MKMINYKSLKVFSKKFTAVLLSFLFLNISINYTSKVKNVGINKVETILELLVITITDISYLNSEIAENTSTPTEEIYNEITWFCNESSLNIFSHYKIKHSILSKVNLPSKIYLEILLPPPLF